MAGRGPAPKPANKRARTNSDPMGIRLVQSEPVAQPPLPELMPDGEPWPEQTRTWWEMWGRSPQSETFTEPDWSFLLDTALMHHAMWSKGQWTLAAEVRLRVAKFGATPEDRFHSSHGWRLARAKSISTSSKPDRRAIGN